MKAERKQITLRLPEKMYEALKQETERTGISVHELIVFAINEFLDKSSHTCEE